MASETSTSGRGHSSKRLIVCCDGTWMDSNIGYEKPTLWRPHGKLQVPSNVTRISRCFKRRCADGMLQIIGYESGVGADKEGSNALNTLSGGAFGIGLAERVREAYSYLCANYIDGDEIILVGFSRGAFTARSVAGIIGNLGLLTREGVEHFYPIFKDMQNWMNDSYADPFPDSPFPNKPKGPNAADEYRARLEKLGYTRVYQGSGELIKVKAVCVWDTVGSLGIPRIGWLDKLGIRASNDEYKWHDTSLSNRIEHAFHALALDECRAPFSPAVWERLPEDKRTTDLRQVWFPGNHGNCGGGWEDQGIANCSLAWMMDQMASIGVEFDKKSLDRIFTQSVDYYQNLEETTPGKTLVSPWAIEPIYKNNRPLRPWSLGAIRKTTGLLYWLSGEIRRTPGLYRQIDKPGLDPSKFLQDTNERIHSSVRVRLACKGLGLNDRGIWACEPLKNWTLKRTKAEFDDPIARHPSWGLGEENQVDQPGLPGSERYVWEYSGPEEEAPTDPRQRVMVEDKMGPYERYLLRVTGGKPNVYEFADSGYVD